ncbi:hypothetical protein [Microbacterium laevaniformans]|uniref:hypothetical protein n=1 Tax=Microbacterium laevaniformans TaxID=36807 RepID=UPI0036394A62
MTELSSDQTAERHSSGAHPRIRATLQNAEHVRARTLSLLAGEPSGALDALEAMTRIIAATELWVDVAPAPLAKEFVGRISSDFWDGVDGVLKNKVPSVLDPCRDLMELQMLFREFRLAPSGFKRWSNIKDPNSLGDFKFGRLARRFPDQPLQGFRDVDAALTEYTQHSRTLHPQFPLTFPLELSREPANLPEGAVLPWALSMILEVLRHTHSALVEFGVWHGERFDPQAVDASREIDPALALDAADLAIVHDWLERQAASKSTIPDALREAYERSYRVAPKP